MLISRINKSRLLTLFSIISLVVLLLTALIRQASAFSPNYNSSDLIDNGTFTNNSAMTVNAIQSFFSNIGSGLTNVQDVEACDSTIAPYYSHCGQTISAAQIVYDAAQAYGINPEDILATMQKEQSLVTMPAPNPSNSSAVASYNAALDCAMGYNSCGGDVGFFTQVDNGAWDLARNYEGASQVASWKSWSPASTYPCASAKSGFYNNGLYPGNTVTFADSGGTSETVTISNAATASLYCYTPYVGPYSQTGYSGSYNFVYYFQLWFGSTQSSMPYAWDLEGQGAYLDSGHTEPFTSGIYMAPGQTAYLSVDARNVGYDSWGGSFVHLGTTNAQDRDSVFTNSSWLSPNRIAMVQSNVDPGQDATFDFSITAPSTPGTYDEYFNMVADGITWMNNPGMYFTINVVQPQSPTNTTDTGLTTNQKLNVGQHLLSPDGQNTLALQSNGDLILYSDAAPIWSNGVNNNNASYVVMQSDGNLVEYDKSGNPLWGSGTVGNPNDYLTLQTDGNAVIYSQTNTPLWGSGTASTPGYLDKVDQSIPDGGVLYPGQSLQTDNLQYRLILQTDGNLVEYHNGQAIWSSGTAGQASALLAMQSDGNLVIYNTSGKAIWASNTSPNGGASLILRSNGAIDLEQASGSMLWSGDDLYQGESIGSNNYTLDMQSDGNLVEYNQLGYPIWGSGTVGKGAYATMQNNGYLEVHNSSGGVVWASAAGANGSYLALQSDGNMVIYNSNTPSWGSGTAGR